MQIKINFNNFAPLPQLGSVPAAYGVVAGGCDWSIQQWRHFVTFLTLRALCWLETRLCQAFLVCSATGFVNVCHSNHPSPHHSSLPTAKLFCSSNPTLHRHLTPLRTDFTDIRTALRFFLRFSFFLVSVIVISFFFSFSISNLLHSARFTTVLTGIHGRRS